MADVTAEDCRDIINICLTDTPDGKDKISFDLRIPSAEEVALSLKAMAGNIPKSIGARHYMGLKRKADQFPPRCAEHIT